MWKFYACLVDSLGAIRYRQEGDQLQWSRFHLEHQIPMIAILQSGSVTAGRGAMRLAL